MRNLILFLLLSTDILVNAQPIRIGTIASSVVIAPTYDSNAVAFFTATGITDLTQKGAVNQRILDLKASGLWIDVVAFWPMVGGAATAHKYNAKDPRDLDTAYRLTFNGTFSHTSSGVDPDGSTAYADTHIIPASVLSLNSVCLQYYSTENGGNVASYEMGVYDGTARLSLIIKYADNSTYSALNTADISQGNIVSDTRGLFTTSRTASNVTAFYRNAPSINTGTTSSVALPITYPIYLFASNGLGTASDFSNRNCAGAIVFKRGLTSVEVAADYTSWQTFQTTLGR